MEQNNLQQAKEIFYCMMYDKNLTLEEVRKLATAGYGFILNHNQELKNLYSDIGKLTTI